MRTLLALAALPLLATFAPLSLFREPSLPALASLTFTPVPLDPAAAGRRRLGALHYLGGWHMRSNDPRFGGISAMKVRNGGVVAVSDSGSLIEFALPGSGTPRLSIRPLPEGPGPRARKLERDSETLAIHGGEAWIAFEGSNSIWRYALPSWRSKASAAPGPMRRWPGNQGSEAMLRLPDGRFLLFSEDWRRPDGSTDVVLFDGDPALPATATSTLGYRAPEGFRITDAALLPDGRLLFLNRRLSLFGGVSAKLTVAEQPRLSAGSVIAGEEIAHLKAPLTVDNMEALSVTREGGRTIVWIASDNNFMAMQRSLLLKFALLD